MNFETWHIAAGVATFIILLFVIFGRKSDSEPESSITIQNEELKEPVPQEPKQDVAVEPAIAAASVVSASTNQKRRVQSKRGFRLNRRNQRSYDDFDDTLFDMTFAGFLHPYRLLYLHDWFFDNDLLDEDEYSIDLGADNLIFAGAVLAEVFYNDDGQRVLEFFSDEGELINAVTVSSSGEVFVDGVSYLVDDETGTVTIESDDNVATWSDDAGYSINSSLADESLDVQEGGQVEYSESNEPEPVVESEPEPVVES